GDVILVLHECVQICKARDFGLQNERFDLTIERKISPGPGPIEVCLTQALDLDFPDKFTHPLPSLRLLRREPNARGWLREHDLGDMSVEVFKLGFALKPQHDRVPALACFGNGRMELGEFLQARQLVDDEPYSSLCFLRLIQE